MHDVLVIGAGIAGLACAGALVQAGASVVVVEKGKGVGGRCATRRIEGQPVDHGLAFLHGTDPDLLAAIDAVDAPRITGWPRAVTGQGTPCHPAAFDPASRRLAFREGVNVFPRHLARTLDVRTNTRITRLELAAGLVTAHPEEGAPFTARTLVLALPPEQASALLAPVPELAAADALLGTVVTHPCWTVIARYAGADDPLEAEMFYPLGGPLHLVAHDSQKRVTPRVRTLVLQARPSWSAANIELPAEAVQAALLAEVGTLLGPWAATPTVAYAHRWRYARLDRGTGLSAPYLMALPQGPRIGLAGEAFDPAGGAEAAFRSGRRLARRIAFGGADG